MDNSWVRKSLLYLVIIIAAITIFFMFSNQLDNPQEIGINEVVELAKNKSGSSKLEIEVQGVGVLRNTVAAAKPTISPVTPPPSATIGVFRSIP